MSSSMMLVKATCMAMMMCVILYLPQTLAAITCGQVDTKLAPCVPYVIGSGGDVPKPCCDGVQAINNEAATKADRQAACVCIEKAAKGLPGLNVDVLIGLPGKCGVNLPYNLGPSTDCNKIE